MVETAVSQAGDDRACAVREALYRILKSRYFAGSPRLSQFLRYVVEHTLDGDPADLKETCIGVAVFGKAASYDPKEEPIVRVEARRLRTRLDEYYALPGAHDPIRIRLPKGGYQALFEDTDGSLPPPAMPASAETVPEPPATLAGAGERQRWCGALLGGLLVCCVVILAVLFVSRWTAPKPLRFSRVGPLTSSPGNELQPAVSHDGKHLAFVWSGEKGDNYDVYVKLIDVGSAVRLTTASGYDLAPQWSLDDRFISYLRVTEQGTSVYVVPSLGGTETRIAGLRSVGGWKADPLQVQTGSGAPWTLDGKALIVSDGDGSGAISLYAVALDGSPRRRISLPPDMVHDFNAAISPDGKRLAFVRETSNSSGDVFVSLIDGSAPRQITMDRMRVRGITWTSDSNRLIFASNRSGADELWQVSAGGGNAELIATKGYEVASPSISPDERLLIYSNTQENSNIWRLEIDNSNAKPELFIASPGRNDSARYSPDGTHVAFISDRSGSWELWVANDDGRGPRQLTHFGGSMVGTPHWSPDSQSLVFDARPQGHSAIFTIALGGGSPEPAVSDAFENKKPNWSRDGRSLYYTSNRAGPTQLWRSGVRGEHPMRLTESSTNDSAESVDGLYVYFQNDAPGIYRVPAAGGSPELIKGLENVYPSRYFDVSDQIYFLDQETLPRTIRRFDPATHAISLVGRIGSQLVYGTPSLSISPDRRFIIFAQQDSSKSEIMALRH